MAIYIDQNKKIKNIFANVNGKKKSISSVWANKDGVPTKVFQLSNSEIETDPYEVAPENEYSNWRYRLDTENYYIILERYNNTSIEDVIVYNSYEIGGTIYKTKISSNLMYWSYNPSKYSTNDYMFSQKINIKTITFGNGVDTIECLKMGAMFFGCTALTNIKFGNNFITKNTTNMEQMFWDCQSLISLDLSSFDTANVTSMFAMFYGCKSLQTIYVSHEKWSTSKATTTSMFNGCGTSSVTYKE